MVRSKTHDDHVDGNAGNEDTGTALRLFEEALEVAEGEREAWLEHRCAGNEAVREEVRRLLRRDAEAEELPDLVDVADLSQVFAASREVEHARGTYIGGFEIVRLIAEGGMGRVYEARQKKPERRVALKVLRVAFTSSDARRRFAYEAEILARLQHPSIAQVYAAGIHAENGEETPFFAMEYVEAAQSLVQHAGEQSLTRRERVELLARICDAVHHGHQKGVVHRDLKPANILVGRDGAPKIIDYGVARATDLESEETAVRTRAGDILGTLPYMSPEQLEGDVERLDTRTDVYSLGVILCELLCGERPHRLGGKPLLEAARLLRETPARRPSEVDETVDADLDVITLQALMIQPGDRYASAAELASDLRRYLRGETILARPPSTWYAARKFAVRNKTTVGIGLALGFSLIIGLATTSILYRQARAAHAAELQARRSAEKRLTEVRNLAGTLVFELNEDLRGLAGSTPLRKKIVERALAALARLEPDADGDVAFQLELARSYMAIGAVQGHPDGPNLGDRQGAIASYARALSLLEELPGSGTHSAKVRRYTADNLRSSAGILVHEGELDEACARFERALELLDELEEDVAQLAIRADAHDGMSDLLQRQGQQELALGHAEEALILREVLLEEDPGNVVNAQLLAKAVDQAGRAHARNGDLKRAVEEHRRSRKILTDALAIAPDDPRLREGLSYCLHHLAQSLQLRLLVSEDTEMAEEVLEITRRDVEIMRALLETDPSNENYLSNYAATLSGYGNACHALRNPAALAAYEEVLQLAEQQLAQHPDSFRERFIYAGALTKVAMGLEIANRFDDSIAAYQRARTAAAALAGEHPRDVQARRGPYVVNMNAGAVHKRLAEDEARGTAARIDQWELAIACWERSHDALDSMRVDDLILGFDVEGLARLERLIDGALAAIVELEGS